MDEKLFEKVCYAYVSALAWLAIDPTPDDLLVTEFIVNIFDENELKLIKKLGIEYLKQGNPELLESLEKLKGEE